MLACNSNKLYTLLLAVILFRLIFTFTFTFTFTFPFPSPIQNSK
jgi:hypothetical protein